LGSFYKKRVFTFADRAARDERRIIAHRERKAIVEEVRRTVVEETIDTKAYNMASKPKQLKMREHNNNRKLDEFGGVS